MTTAFKKIEVSEENPLILLRGDEMSRVSFDRTIAQFISKYLNIGLQDFDLSATGRLGTNGEVIKAANKAIGKHGIAIKDATITPKRRDTKVLTVLAGLNAKLQGMDKEEKAEFLKPFFANQEQYTLDKPVCPWQVKGAIKGDTLQDRFNTDWQNFTLDYDDAANLAVNSPNGGMRAAVGGNIDRKPLPINNLLPAPASWKGKNIQVRTMASGGKQDSINTVINSTEPFEAVYTLIDHNRQPLLGEDGKPVLQKKRAFADDASLLLGSCDIAEMQKQTAEIFAEALEKGMNVSVGAKDTVIKGYDGVMVNAVRAIYEKGIDPASGETFQARFKARALENPSKFFADFDAVEDPDTGKTPPSILGLIDSQAASIIGRAPNDVIWFIPDSSTGRKMEKLVNALKEDGMATMSGLKNCTISRMCTGGEKRSADHYGADAQAVPMDGYMELAIFDRNGTQIFSKEQKINAGDPFIFMSNERAAIEQWVETNMREIAATGERLVFGLNRMESTYDAQFYDIILEKHAKLTEEGLKLPPIVSDDSRHVGTEGFMSPSEYLENHRQSNKPVIRIERSSALLTELVTDPPSMPTRLASLNLDGDIYSDILSELTGSLATSESIIHGVQNGVDRYIFEAPHGTAPDLFNTYNKTGVAGFNPTAQMMAFINGLNVIAERENNDDLKKFSNAWKEALFDTINSGIVTRDIQRKTKYGQGNLQEEAYVDMYAFMDVVEARMQQKLGMEVDKTAKVKLTPQSTGQAVEVNVTKLLQSFNKRAKGLTERVIATGVEPLSNILGINQGHGVA